MKTTVLVIGGGATGAGVARDLAMRGVDVTLVERGRFAEGTSGRSHGLLHSGARYAVDDPEGAADCLAESRILKEIAPHCIDDTGGYFLQTEEDDSGYFDRKRAACKRVGIEAESVEPDDARRKEPQLAEGIERVLEVPDGVIHPTRLTAANAADAREHGARLLSETEVRDVLRDDDRVVGAVVDDGSDERRINAEHVVNATGAWAGELGELAGVEIGMAPTSGVMVAVEFDGLDTVLNRARPAADGDIVIPHDEQVILGTTSVDVDDPDDVSTDDAEIDLMFEECSAMLSGLDRDRIDRTYWGVRPLYTEDRERYEGRQISRGFYLLDHRSRDDIAGLTSIVGGKLTTYRRMAEAVSDQVVARLGVEEPCRTAETPLFGHDDPGRIDAIVREFGAENPADRDVIGR